MNRPGVLSRTNPWSNRQAARATLTDAVGLRGKAWIARCLLAKRFGTPALAPRQQQRIRFSRLRCSVLFDATIGGLSAYYEIEHVRVYGQPPTLGQTVVDVGANIGVFSAWAGTHVGPEGKLLAIEPHPIAFSLLEQTVGGFPCEATAVACAVGSRPGRKVLTVPAGKVVESTLQDGVEGAKYDVVVSTIDAELAKHGIDRVHLMKIDVEGWELESLNGAVKTLARCERVVIETTHLLRADVEVALLDSGMKLATPLEGVWGTTSLCIIRARR